MYEDKKSFRKTKIKKPPRLKNFFPLGTKGEQNKNKMNFDFDKSNPFQNSEVCDEPQNFKAVSSDGFFVLQKPNCYLQDGMLQTDFIAYNLSLDDMNLTEEVLYKLNVCPSHVLQTFQALETQMHTIKPLIEQEIERDVA